MPKDQMVHLSLPCSAWDTLRETLELDAKSSTFDVSLRRQIRSALDAVRVEPGKELYLVHVEGDIEPRIAAGPFPQAELKEQVIAVMRKNHGLIDEDQDDGLYLLTIKDGKPEIDTLAGDICDLDECREAARYFQSH